MDILDWLPWISGPQAKNASPLQRTDYPSAADVQSARSADAMYGYAGGSSQPRIVPDIHTIIQLQGPISGPTPPSQTALPQKIPPRAAVPQSISDQMYAGWLGAQRNAVSALGFNPANIQVTPAVPNAPNLNVAGLYSPASDNLWYDSRFPSAVVHESMHRGIQALRQAGLTTVGTSSNFYPEETYVRALMAKNFGDVELGGGNAGDEQVRQGQEFLKNHADAISALEDAAAKLYRQRDHKMGPR